MQHVAPTRHLTISTHVRACESDGTVVLLDLNKNRYVGIGGAGARALVGQVEGWPMLSDAVASANPELCGKVVHGLLSQGLLSEQSVPRGSEATLEAPTATLNSAFAMTLADIGIRRMGRFLFSAALAHKWMYRMPLYDIATEIGLRRNRIPANASGPLDAMRAGIETYEKLRPLVFTARDRCLYDSLALVLFLSMEGLLARWVIGVKTGPFGAHAWVQSGPTVLNDHHEYVGQFRPILVV